MVIQHNMVALNACRQYNIVEKRKAKHTEKLSSGFRINRSADDAAGLSISEKMRRQIRGLTQGVENTKDGVSLCQVADGALNEAADMLQRMNELSVQAANGTDSKSDREYIQMEIDQILSEIDRISDTTTFNTQNIFGGASAGTEATAAQGVSAYLAGSTTQAAFAAQTYSVGGITSYAAGTTCGGFTIIGGTVGVDFTIGGGSNPTLTIISDRKLEIVGNGMAVAQQISIANGVNANVTLNNVKIDMTQGNDFSPIVIAENSSGNVTLTLKGDNYLRAKYWCSALQKNGTGANVGTLKITGSGTLTAIGGTRGAAIGGGDSRGSRNIVIDGEGTVVIAVGGSQAADAIGSGSGVSSTGASVNRKNGLIIEGNKGAVYGDVLLTDDVTVGNGVTLTIDSGKKLAVSDGITLTNNGTINNNGTIELIKKGDIIDNGTINGNAPIRRANAQQGGIPMGGAKQWWIQSGCDAGDGIYLTIDVMNIHILGIDGLNVTTEENAAQSIGRVGGAITKLSAMRSKIGVQQNRLEHTIDNGNNIIENTTAAESRIRDTDMAEEVVSFSIASILVQSGEAMLAQANMGNEGVLALLR